ncbi:MAG: rod shape-determining protein RodA, partial [Bacteroidales bacterium]|nr:rod shape-determining protein RodA [Candidatus Cryptobacteroides equifaecalis]
MTNGSNTKRSLSETLDWGLIITYLLLVFIGWINIYAAIHSSEPSSIFDWSCRSGKQAVWILTAFILDLVILFAINPRLWEVISVPAYAFVLVLLVSVIFLGIEVKGSRSWFAFGPVRFQPAEISKITTSLMLAAFMSRPSFKMYDPKQFAAVAAIIGIPMLAILGESETGSALVYVGFIFMLYREGFSGWFLFMMGMAILLFILTLMTSWWISAIVLLVVVGIILWRVIRNSERKIIAVKIAAIRNVILAALAGFALIFATDFIFDNVLQEHQKKRIEVLLGMKEDPA